MHSGYRHQKTRHWPGLSELFCSCQNSFLFFLSSCDPDTGAEPIRLITSSRNLNGNISFVHFSIRFRINSRYNVSASFVPSIMPGICAELFRSNCLYFILSRLLNSAQWKIKKSRRGSSIRSSVRP